MAQMTTTQRIRTLLEGGLTPRVVAAILDVDPADVQKNLKDPVTNADILVSRASAAPPPPRVIPAFRDAPVGAVTYLPGDGKFSDAVNTMTPPWVTLVNFNSQAHAFFFDVTTGGDVDFTSQPVGAAWDAFASIWKEPKVDSGIDILATGNDEAGNQHPAFTLPVTPGRYWITMGYRAAGNSGGQQISQVKLTTRNGAVVAP